MEWMGALQYDMAYPRSLFGAPPTSLGRLPSGAHPSPVIWLCAPKSTHTPGQTLLAPLVFTRVSHPLYFAAAGLCRRRLCWPVMLADTFHVGGCMHTPWPPSSRLMPHSLPQVLVREGYVPAALRTILM